MILPSDKERAAEMLTCSANISRIEFYSWKYENKDAALNCRIFGLSPMTELEIKVLAESLNKAIEPVLELWSKSKLTLAMERLNDGQADAENERRT